MSKIRQRVNITLIQDEVLADVHFKEKVPPNVIVRKNPRTITHYHSYGGLSKFFAGLTRGKIYGTKCDFCPDAQIWLPPRVDCPDCWRKMLWSDIDPEGAWVYSYSVANYHGAGFKGTVPCPLISVEIPGVWTKLMSFMSEFGEGEPSIGMKIRPVFRTQNPTYTILDLSWVPYE